MRKVIAVFWLALLLCLGGGASYAYLPLMGAGKGGPTGGGGGGTWSKKQTGATMGDSANSATLAVTFGSAITSGDAVTCIGAMDNAGTPTISTATDDKSNTYNQQAIIRDTTNGQAAFAISLGNITNGPITITVTLGTGQSARSMVCDEWNWSGGATAADPRDVPTGQVQASPGTGTDGVTSGDTTTTVNGDLLVGLTMGYTATVSSGTGFTPATSIVSGTLYASLYSEYMVQTTAGGSTHATFTQNANDVHVTWIIPLKHP